MSNVAIRMEGLGKLYHIRPTGKRGKTFSEKIKTVMVSSFSHLQWTLRKAGESSLFWALRDVSLDIEEGEVVGILGRNGAGKSTLLKLLSRITEPTVGQAEVNGRVGSLLEVGTGFHPDLTGRENIYVNGLMMGMGRKEIDDLFDEIVDFSEVEQFIDTPVKYYSSGMYVRLAFGVAAHIDPEILMVDEVLAVGDFEFQKKCLKKMESVSKAGRTVLFVSHNIGSILSLCNRSILLHKGQVVADGPTSLVVDQYLNQGLAQNGERVWEDMNTAPRFNDRFPQAGDLGEDTVRLRAIRVLDSNGRIRTNFDVRDPVTIEVEYVVLKERFRLITHLYFTNEFGHTIFTSMDNLDSPWKDKPQPAGLYRSRCTVPADLMNESHIRVEYLLQTRPSRYYVTYQDAISFQVTDTGNPNGVRGNWVRAWPKSMTRPRLPWSVERIAKADE